MFFLRAVFRLKITLKLESDVIFKTEQNVILQDVMFGEELLFPSLPTTLILERLRNGLLY